MRAMRSLSSQISKEVQRRTPEEREAHGVQNWAPIQDRVESVTSIVLNALGEEDITLDSLLVLSQAMTKGLQIVVDDLGRDGLGKVRTSYCEDALNNISRDTHRALQHLKGGLELN